MGSVNPKLSIVVSAYNVEKYICDCLDSILNQTFEDFELLIFNDGSTDKTGEIISSYKDSRIIFTDSKVNQGVVYWSNIGLKNSKGKYILRFDSDDVNYLTRFQEQWDFMEKNPQIGVSSSYVEILGTNELILKPLTDIDMRWWIFKGTPLVQGSVIIRKSVLEENNVYYNEEFKSAEDVDFWIQLAKVTEMANIPKPLFKYRIHNNQESTANIERQNYYRDLSMRYFFEWLCINDDDSNINYVFDLFSDLKEYNSSNLICLFKFFNSLNSKNAVAFFGKSEIKFKKNQLATIYLSNLLDYHPRLLFLNQFYVLKSYKYSTRKYLVFVLKCLIFWKTQKINNYRL